MATMLDLVSQKAAEQNTTSPLDHLPEAIQTGVKLAQAKQGLEAGQQQLDQQKTELAQKKLSGVTNIAKAYMFANDAQAPAIYNRLKAYGEQTNTPIALDALSAIRKDEPTRLAAQKALNDLTLGKVPENPSQVLSMFSDDQALFNHVNDMITSNAGNQNKNTQANTLEAAKAAAAEKVAGIRGQSTVDAASLRAQGAKDAAAQRNEGKLITSDLQANRQYTQVIGKAEDGLNASTRALDIIDKVDSGELKADKTLRSDLTSAMGSLVNGGKPATVYGMSHQEFDSAFSNVKDKLNFLQGKAENTLPPAQLKQLQLDIQALKHEYGIQHEDAYSSFREGLSDHQKEKLDNRFSKMRAQKGLDAVSFGGNASAPAQTAPQAAAQVSSKLSANQQSFISKAIKTVNPQTGQPYTPAEATAALSKYNVK